MLRNGIFYSMFINNPAQQDLRPAYEIQKQFNF